MIIPSKDVSSVNGSTNFVNGKYFHFYDKLRVNKSCLPLLYQQMLAEAKDSIVIWDPHYHECKGTVFSRIQQNNIRIEILTICENEERKSDIKDFARNILKAIDGKKVPKCQVTIHALMPRKLRKTKWTEWHDRFLIIDNKDVYLVGASLDGHESSSKSHGICQLTETEDINLVIDAYNAYRDHIIDTSGGANGNGYKCTINR